MAEQGSRRKRGDSDHGDEVPADRFAIKVSVTPESFAEIMRTFDLDVGDRPHIEPERRGPWHALRVRPEAQIRELETAGYTIEVGENISETGRQRMAEVAEGDRFRGRARPTPRSRAARPGGRAEKGGAAR